MGGAGGTLSVIEKKEKEKGSAWSILVVWLPIIWEFICNYVNIDVIGGISSGYQIVKHWYRVTDIYQINNRPFLFDLWYMMYDLLVCGSAMVVNPSIFYFFKKDDEKEKSAMIKDSIRYHQIKKKSWFCTVNQIWNHYPKERIWCYWWN